jgi:hypothetical protein
MVGRWGRVRVRALKRNMRAASWFFVMGAGREFGSGMSFGRSAVAAACGVEDLAEADGGGP